MAQWCRGIKGVGCLKKEGERGRMGDEAVKFS